MSTLSASTLIEQTLTVRELGAKLLRSIPAEKADTIPATWKNNARWHAGHLIVTPCLLTYGIAKEPLPVPEEYRAWFGKGTSPETWGDDPVPDFRELTQEVAPTMERLFAAWADRLNEPFPEPYLTSVGVTLSTPGEALNFNICHDGMHLGMLLALRRAL